MTSRVYLDWNATAPSRPEARAAMLAAMDVTGNPSSVHAEGRAARAIVERARAEVAVAVGAMPDEVIFTSGATEAAALALAGRGFRGAPVEHDCVAAWVETSLAVDTNGAGDTHAGVLCAALAVGRTMRDAVRLANVAAAISVTREGPATSPTVEELGEALTGSAGV